MSNNDLGRVSNLGDLEKVQRQSRKESSLKLENAILGEMSITWEEWNPGDVVDRFIEVYQERAPMVGKFLEDEARKRLDAITHPRQKRPANYRKYLSKYILTHVVEEDWKSINVLVGMKIGQRGQTHHGFYIETGSRTAAAHPYLRPALLQNQREVLDIIGVD